MGFGRLEKGNCYSRESVYCPTQAEGLLYVVDSDGTALELEWLRCDLAMWCYYGCCCLVLAR